jgi:hypothetical protein
MNVTPHVAAKAKDSAIDRRTTRHAGGTLLEPHRFPAECPE